jgi:hypothetical protein
LIAVETVFAEIKRYVEWSREDEQSLRQLHVEAAPHFARIADQSPPPCST